MEKGFPNPFNVLASRKNGVPDLTMVDFAPELPRVPDAPEKSTKRRKGTSRCLTPRPIESSPEGLLEKVTAERRCAIPRLGYVCVRNRIGDESYELARNEEAKLFDAHRPAFPRLNKSMRINPGPRPESYRIHCEILGSAKDSLKKNPVAGRFDEYPEEKDMHCSARIVEMLNATGGVAGRENPGQK
nr:dynamin-related protein 4C-like [Ipomoea batatas]